MIIGTYIREGRTCRRGCCSGSLEKVEGMERGRCADRDNGLDMTEEKKGKRRARK